MVKLLLLEIKIINIKSSLLPRALLLFDIGMAENITILTLGHRPNIKTE